jgi:hypothetical protein
VPCTRETARLAKIITAGWHQTELISAFASSAKLRANSSSSSA